MEVELRNENSEVEDCQVRNDSDNEEDPFEFRSEDEDPNCDEAPADEDVRIPDAQRVVLPTQDVRRSRRLQSVETQGLDLEDTFST